MKRVYLFCSAGMSTSMLASKMQQVANSHDLPIEVEAFPDGKIAQIISERHPDVILLGPQVKYRYGEIVEKYGGSISFDAKDHVFNLNILFPLGLAAQSPRTS